MRSDAEGVLNDPLSHLLQTTARLLHPHLLHGQLTLLSENVPCYFCYTAILFCPLLFHSSFLQGIFILFAVINNCSKHLNLYLQNLCLFMFVDFAALFLIGCCFYWITLKTTVVALSLETRILQEKEAIDYVLFRMVNLQDSYGLKKP